MIIHIGEWLRELKKLHTEFVEACGGNDAFSIERSLYYSALIIRKLSETPFIKPGFLSKSIDVCLYEPEMGKIDGLNWTEAELHFNFDHGKSIRISLADTCNILIHSQFLDWRPATGQVETIFAAGGIRARAEAVGFQPMTYISLLEYVAKYDFKRVPLRPARRGS